MVPVDLPGKPEGQWELADKNGYIIYANAAHPNVDTSSLGRKFHVHRLPQQGGGMVYWLEK